MRTTITSGMMILSFIAFAFFGCERKSTAPSQSTIQNLSAIQDQSSTVVNDNISFTNADSLAVDSSGGVFEIDWHQFVGPLDESATLRGDASVVVFNGTQQQVSPQYTHAGKDVGDVYLNYAGNRVLLNKETDRRGGTFYSTLARMFLGTGSSNIAFVPNTQYEFDVTGSTGFTPLNASIVTPSALISITSDTNGTVISTSNDLTVQWSGGTTAGILIRLLPSMTFGFRPDGTMGGPNRSDRHTGGGNPPDSLNGGHPRGPGGPGPHQEPPMEIGEGDVIRLDTNPGSYTIPSAKIQEVLSKWPNTTELAVCVSQLTSNEVQHDGGTLKLVMRNGDRVIFALQ